MSFSRHALKRAAAVAACFVAVVAEAVTNGYCSVTAGGKALDVFMLPRPNKDFSYQRESDLNPYGAVFFESEGETEVEGTFADGKRFSFRAHPPFTRVVENGGRHGALVVCANRPERDVPDRNDPKVKWFGPGRHRPGEIRLTSGETLYLEAGAVVEAPVLAEGKDISVRGRGILSGIPWAWRKGPSGWCWTFRGERISIRDVTFAGAWNWAVVLERTKDVTVDGVRILGGKALNDDGIDVCRSENVTIRNAFIRSQDDCIAPKWWCRNLLVEDCTLWTDYANIVRLGWECDPQGGPFENLVFRNLKVCHLAMEKRPASHAWFNSAFCLQASNGQTIRDVTFDRVDFTSVEPGDIQFVAYTGPCGPFAGGGRIDQVHLRNFTVPSGSEPMITRYAAHAPGEIGRVTLESVAGRKAPELVNDDGPTEAVEVAGMPDARPGLEVSAEIVFGAVPKDGITFLGNEAWSLMYQPWHGQGSFAFQVGSKWYNTALAEQPIETGKVYRVTGSWDGAVIRVAVEGGKEGRQIRRDPLPPVREPTVMWPFAGTVKAYSAKVVRKPIVHLFDLKSKDLLPRAGKPFTLTGEAFSGGTPVADAVLVAEVKTPGASVTPARIPLGKRFAGMVPCEWAVEAGTNSEVAVDFRVEAEGWTLCAETKDIVVMPAEDPDFAAAKWNPPERPTRTFYVDALAGDDARDGLKPQSAWKTLGRLRGRVLGPGERLLLRRGSVFNEELEISACGHAENWASVGAYGTGARPTIRRDRMFDQRCLLVTNAAYFAARDLIVCNAGKGLCIENQPGVGGHVLVENCLAHHIEGSYRWNAHGIPEWRDLSAPKDGGVGAIALTGMRHLVFRDCETYQNSWGFNVKGDDLWIGRIYTHDNASPNTSPHPMITGTKRAWYVDSVLDASGWNASAGTMGIMLCVNRGFVLRGVHFLNMPDSASWDEGGVDFESGGEGILVDRCTFRRNAGAAIEVLGLYTPQARNLHFRECRFDRNNWANNLGPSEIYIHGAQEKSIDCSCGLIERCGYVLEPGVAFYTNKSCHSSKAWTLKDNREWPTAEQLDRAMPWGDPPTVSAGSEIWTSARTVRLAGVVEAGDRKVDVAWETREGPGEIRFEHPDRTATAATFPCAGDWRVALKADDGRLWRSARTAVHVLPEGSVTMRAWSFAKNHDLEGWTHWNLGTTREVFKGKSAFWDTFANPVHDVVGDCYVVALKGAKGAYLLSPDDLYLSKNGVDRVRIRMQNRTNAVKMRLRYLTTVDMDWDDAKSVVFDVTPEDRDERVCEIPLALRGHLKRLRLDFAANEASVTGTVRIDYIWAGRVVAH